MNPQYYYSRFTTKEKEKKNPFLRKNVSIILVKPFEEKTTEPIPTKRRIKWYDKTVLIFGLLGWFTYMLWAFSHGMFPF